ncbi:hypothetical protein CPB86DRAFT_802667 [Serendipita vermifera]|nr:hypothetical protein CPB86DRAFT_802667 [Serendipita vermifera]
MSVLALKDTTVELTTGDDCFLTDIVHLILEITQNGQVVHKVNLWSQESNRGVWNADQTLVLREVTTVFTISVFMQVDESDRLLLSSVELNERELLDTVGGQYEIPLIRQEDYPDLILRSRVHSIESTQELVTAPGQQTGGDSTQKMVSEGLAAGKDFENHENLQRLDEAIFKSEYIVDRLPKEDPRFCTVLSILGCSLLARFEQLGRVADMNSGMERLEMAVDLTPDDDPNKSNYLNNLGNSLRLSILHQLIIPTSQAS